MSYFTETLYDSVAQQIRIDRLYYEARTEHQHLMIFHNACLGRVMTLDGVVQTTEADEFIYHEMLTHVPMFGHGAVRDVLIIGGGDGGMLREALRHTGVRATLVEIDAAVIEMAREYLPNHSAGAFDDARAEIVITDGFAYVADSERQFDVIISDSTDPIGPAETLFSADFYRHCAERLRPGGVLVTQNGVPFYQPEELADTWRRLGRVFSDRAFYIAAVPTYAGGHMAFGWGSDDPGVRQVPVDELWRRFNDAGLQMRYYDPDVHAAAFALPRFMRASLESS